MYLIKASGVHTETERGALEMAKRHILKYYPEGEEVAENIFHIYRNKFSAQVVVEVEDTFKVLKRKVVEVEAMTDAEIFGEDEDEDEDYDDEDEDEDYEIDYDDGDYDDEDEDEGYEDEDEDEDE